MNDYLLGLIVSIIAGILFSPLVIWVWGMIKDTRERREIKRAIFEKRILQPIDVRDYESQKWKDIINVEQNKQYLNSLNERIFKKKQEIMQ